MASSSKSRDYAVRAALEQAKSAQMTMQDWRAQESARVVDIQNARPALAAAPSASRFEALITHLQHVRHVAMRRPLSPEQIALIPRQPAFLDALIDLCLHPLSMEAGKHAGILVPAMEEDMKEDDRVSFYMRQLGFINKAALLTFLEEALKKAPQYAYLAARIQAEASILADDVKIFLGYGGYTIANDASGRCETDAEVESGRFITTILELYEEDVKIFTFPALEFKVKGVIPAREDPRTSLFESLVVDSFGLVCANTAPPGQHLTSLRWQSTKLEECAVSLLAPYSASSDMLERLRSMSLSNPSTGSSKPAAKAKATSSSTNRSNALQPKDKNLVATKTGKDVKSAARAKDTDKGKGKARAIEEDSADVSSGCEAEFVKNAMGKGRMMEISEHEKNVEPVDTKRRRV